MPTLSKPSTSKSSPAPESPPAITAPGPSASAKRTYHEVIAEVVHEANRVLTAHAGDVPVAAPWSEYPDGLRKSVIDGIESFIENPDVGPERQHEEWCRYKTEQGWTQNGIYSAEGKTHPHLKAYGALAPEVRLKDAMLRAIVITMLKLK